MADNGVQATQAGPGVQATQAGPGVRATQAGRPTDRRYLLPDVCLSGGVFLDGSRPADLPVPVEIVPTDGVALRQALIATADRG